MSEPMIWSYLIHLSTHMWGDGSEPPKVWYPSRVYTENNNVDLAVWDDVVAWLGKRKYNVLIIDLGDAVKYESHPEICAPDAWEKDFLKKKLDEIRALGIEPIPKLNFSCGHHTWLKEYNRMVSTPIYYQVCADLIKEVCELFDYPRLFHLGFDEEVPYQPGLEKVMIRGEKLWWHDLFFMAGECEKHGARPWVWSDYYWDFPEVFKKNMPKSILQSNWYYYVLTDHPKDSRPYTRIHTYEYLDELGYDQVLTSSSCHGVPHNNHQTVAYAKDKLTPELVKGFMTAPWYMTTEQNRFLLLNDAELLYFARKAIYPETLEENNE